MSPANLTSCASKLGLSAQFVYSGLGRRFVSLPCTDVDRTFVMMGSAASYLHLYIVCLKGAIICTAASLRLGKFPSNILRVVLCDDLFTLRVVSGCVCIWLSRNDWRSLDTTTQFTRNLKSDYHLQPFRGVLFPRVLCVRSLLTFELIPGFLGSFPSIYSTEVLGVEYVEFPAVCLLRRAGQRIPV